MKPPQIASSDNATPALSRDDLIPPGLRIREQLESFIKIYDFLASEAAASPDLAQRLDLVVDAETLRSQYQGAREILSEEQVLRTTNYARWFFTHRETNKWEERKALIASVIDPGASVWDIGAGNRSLQQYLDPTCAYIPIDCVPSAPNVFVCDYNRDFRVPNTPCDSIVMSGFLEYLSDMDGFFKQLSSALPNRQVLFSWAIPFGQDPTEKLKQGWINPLEFEDEGVEYFSQYVRDLKVLGHYGRRPIYAGTLHNAA